MKTAFAIWDNRIAPVFDTARQLHIVESESERIVREIQEPLVEDLPVKRALRLSELGVGMLVCGAISRPLQALVLSYGIKVAPFVAGELRVVIQAWIEGNLGQTDFAMPGCCGHGRGHRRKMCGIGKDGYEMDGKGRLGAGKGGGQGKGRMGDSFAPGAPGICVCPKCGHREPHEAGLPCIMMQCPKCGIALTRE